ncbi:hypothetical protein, partial [Klebsiella pneumoniae]|uniref:TraG/VirB4 family ATPase n=1 Tax=Klebsiella pneumoniae TaxID=573 RepID=UPI00396929A7
HRLDKTSGLTRLLDGRRLVIFMDEFWKWLRDPVFKDFAYNKLKTIRKLNGMLVVGTQSPAEIIKDDIVPAGFGEGWQQYLD